jgi:predicted O-methyltransferase YrrM
MKTPIYYRRFDYDKALIPNKYLALMEQGVSTIEQAKAKTGHSVGYPGWNLIYHVLLSHLNPKEYNIIIETGTNRGFSTIILAQALKDSACPGKVFTVELDQQCYEIALTNFRRAGVSDFIDATNAHSCEFLKDFAKVNIPVRIAFLDASHLFDDVITEFETLLPLLGPQSIVIFDNTYLIAEEHEDQRVNGALRDILRSHGGNLVNFEIVSWYTPGIAIWQKYPFDSMSISERNGKSGSDKMLKMAQKADTKE